MSRPSPFELELINKIVKASIKLGTLKIEHHSTCPVNDPVAAVACTCGAQEHNRKIGEIISILEIK